MKRVVVREHRPWRRAVVIGLLVTAAVAGTAYHFAGERIRIGTALESVRAERDRLRERVDALAAERERLERETASLGRTLQVEREATREVEAHLRTLQGRILDLEEQVAFYRGIVDSGRARGVRIQTLVVEPVAGSRDLRFEVVLTRSMKSDRVARGTVSVFVAGEQAGEARELATAEELGPRAAGLGFEFRYFQRLEGRLSLPPGFVPRKVRVEVQAPGESPARAERVFEWGEVFVG